MKFILQQPKTLQTLAIEKFGEWIANQPEHLLTSISRLRIRFPTKADELLSRKIEIIRHYLECKLPRVFYDKLATKVMKRLYQLLNKIKKTQGATETNLSYAISRMLETVYTKNLTSLSFTNYPCTIFQQLLYSKSYMLTGLTHLELAQIQAEGDIIRLLKELHGLTFLVLPYCSYNILQCVVDNCKSIETCHVKCSNAYSCGLNDNNIGILTQLPNLKILELNNTAVTHFGIVTVLLSCENIEKVDSFSGPNRESEDLIRPLEYIVSFEQYAEKKFKLKYYKSVLGNSLRQIELVVRMCPLLQEVSMIKYFYIQSNLLPLRDLRNLNKLTLTGFEFYTSQVKELLDVVGNKLVFFSLDYVKQIDMNALKLVCQKCPNLINLIFNNCTFGDNFMVERSNLKNVQSPPLLRLEKLIFLTYLDVTYPTNDQIVSLLLNCPYIESLEITARNVDAVILQCLNKNPKCFMYLKHLWVQHSKAISSLTLDRLVQNCIDPLQVRVPEI